MSVAVLDDEATTDELLAEAAAAYRYAQTIQDSLTAVQASLNLPYLPNHKQAMAHLHPAQGADEPLLLGGAMGGGKSSWAGADAIRECIEVPGNRVLMARRELKTFKATTLQTLLALADRLTGVRHNKSDQLLIFPNGAQLIYGGLGDDDDKRKLLSSEYGALYFDEITELEETSFLLALTRLRWGPARGRYKVRCTCNPWPGWVKERWITNPRPGYAFIPALPLDNLHNLPEDYIEQNRRALPDDWFRAFMLGDWNASMPVDAVFGPMLLDRAARAQLVPGDDCVWGVDVARFGNDLTVVARRRGNVYDFLDQWGKTPVDETADQVVSLVSHARPMPRIVNIDDDGVGGGVTDLCRRAQREGRLPGNVRINGVMAQRGATQDTAHAFDGVHYANVKAMLMYAMVRRAEQDGIDLPDEPGELKSGLEAYKKEVRAGRVHILPKSTVKQLLGFSPDHADAVVLTEFIGRADYVARAGGAATPDAPTAAEQRELAEQRAREAALQSPQGFAGRYRIALPQLRRSGDLGY